MCLQIIKSVAFSALGILTSWAVAQQSFEAGLTVQCVAAHGLRLVLDLLAASGQF